MLNARANFRERPIRLSARQFGAATKLSLEAGALSGVVLSTAHLPLTTTGIHCDLLWSRSPSPALHDKLTTVAPDAQYIERMMES
jgi:hypothetical protein